VVQAGWYLTHTEPGVAAWMLGGVALVCSAGLAVGLLTPGAAMGASVSTVAIAAACASPFVAELATDWRPAAFVAADAIAIAMLGPGAHSIDATLFGRREIVVTDEPRRRTP